MTENVEVMMKEIMSDDKYNQFVERWSTSNRGKRVLRVIEGLSRNFSRYGASYCPCKLEHTPENICPCQDMVENNKCICGLFEPQVVQE